MLKQVGRIHSMISKQKIHHGALNVEKVAFKIRIILGYQLEHPQ